MYPDFYTDTGKFYILSRGLITPPAPRFRTIIVVLTSLSQEVPGLSLYRIRFPAGELQKNDERCGNLRFY